MEKKYINLSYEHLDTFDKVKEFFLPLLGKYNPLSIVKLIDEKTFMPTLGYIFNPYDITNCSYRLAIGLDLLIDLKKYLVDNHLMTEEIQAALMVKYL
jgi:hypothetical protein